MISSSRNNNINLGNPQRLWMDAFSILPSKGLSDEELDYYSLARREDVREDIKKFEAQHASSSMMRGVIQTDNLPFSTVSGLTPRLSMSSRIASRCRCPLSGPLCEWFIQAARAFEEYFTKIVAMLERIGDVLPRFDLYIQMFPTHQNLLIGVSRIYADIIQFCVKSKTSLFC